MCVKRVKPVTNGKQNKFLVNQKNLSTQQFANEHQLASFQQQAQQSENPIYVSPVYRPLRQPLRMSDQIPNLSSGTSSYSTYSCSTPKASGIPASSNTGVNVNANSTTSINDHHCCCCSCRKKDQVVTVFQPLMVNAILTLKHVGYSTKQQNESILNSTSITNSDQSNEKEYMFCSVGIHT